MPVDLFIEIDDPFLRNVWYSIAERVIELRHLRDKNLAIMIANEVWSRVK